MLLLDELRGNMKTLGATAGIVILAMVIAGLGGQANAANDELAQKILGAVLDRANQDLQKQIDKNVSNNGYARTVVNAIAGHLQQELKNSLAGNNQQITANEIPYQTMLSLLPPVVTNEIDQSFNFTCDNASAGQFGRWKNQVTGHEWIIIPEAPFRVQNTVCRKFGTVIALGVNFTKLSGVTCKNAAGGWSLAALD